MFAGGGGHSISDAYGGGGQTHIKTKRCKEEPPPPPKHVQPQHAAVPFFWSRTWGF